MKTKTIIIAIVSAAILFVGAAKVSKSSSQGEPIVSKGTIGGLAAEDK